jgi:hypothetical protein
VINQYNGSLGDQPASKATDSYGMSYRKILVRCMNGILFIFISSLAALAVKV